MNLKRRALQRLKAALVDVVVDLFGSFKIETVDVVIVEKKRIPDAWTSAERLAQCLVWSDSETIECTRPDGIQ